MPEKTIWKADPHTTAKHEILRRYLEGWFPILGSWQGRVHYLDAFAGPGVYEGGEPGSPIVALETLLDHSSFPRLNCEFVFTFLEPRADRFGSLKDQLQELENARGGFPPNVTVIRQQLKFDQGAEQILSGLKGDLAPTFAFIDPFGFKDIDLELVGRLLSFDRCEVLFTFMFDSVNRFLSEGKVAPHLEALFGTDGYEIAAGKTGNDRKEFLHDLFTRQLKAVCKFEHVTSFEMIDNRGHTIYFLFYGTRSLKGLEVMKRAMWKADPGSGSRFMDRFAGHQVLFAGEHVDVGPLRKALLTTFAGKDVSVEEIERFVLTETPYGPGHWKQPVLKPLEKDGIIEVLSSPRKKRYAFPAGTMLRFLVT